MKIRVDEIYRNPMQPREKPAAEGIEELAASMADHGLLNPICVEQSLINKTGLKYRLVDGERRWLAAMQLGWEEIEANVLEEHIFEKQRSLTLALIGNLQRRDMSPIEEARGFAALIEMGMKQLDIGRILGISTSRIANRLKLLELDEEIQGLVAERKLPADIRVTEALLKVPDDEARVQLAKRVAREGVKIETVVQAATKLRNALEQQASLGETPSLRVATIRHGGAAPGRKPLRWDMLRQAGKAPPWEVVTAAAVEVCKDCALLDTASMVTCSECPGALLILEMMRRGE